jgi:hypothetical protein
MKTKVGHPENLGSRFVRNLELISNKLHGVTYQKIDLSELTVVWSQIYSFQSFTMSSYVVKIEERIFSANKLPNFWLAKNIYSLLAQVLW